MEAKVLLSTGTKYSKLPDSYKWPASRRPKPESRDDEKSMVPVIDLSDPDRSRVVDRIREACSRYGFFQVVGHGVPTEAVDGMVGVTKEVFSLPAEEKLKLVADGSDGGRAGRSCWMATSYDTDKEEVHNWRDYLFLHCWPLQHHSLNWPSPPSSFREIVSKYCMEVRRLGIVIEELISESLGLESDCLTNMMGEHGQRMAINFYPECPEPDLTFGLQAHTDPNSLTILLQDSHVSGLQVLNHGRWLSVHPHPNAFVINIGDQLQAVSNGVYKSGWHRAIVNPDKPRFSVASFLCPADQALISAPQPLKANGALYRDFTYAEYQKMFWSTKLDQGHCLDLFKN